MIAACHFDYARCIVLGDFTIFDATQSKSLEGPGGWAVLGGICLVVMLMSKRVKATFVL
jgi:hypothetical protein